MKPEQEYNTYEGFVKVVEAHLPPNTLAIEASFDQRWAVQVELVRGNSHDGSVLVMETFGNEVHVTSICMIHSPIICPRYRCTEYVRIY